VANLWSFVQPGGRGFTTAAEQDSCPRPDGQFFIEHCVPGSGTQCCDDSSTFITPGFCTQFPASSRIHPITAEIPSNSPKHSTPRADWVVTGHVSPHASLDHRSQLDIGVFPELPLYICIRMLATGLRVPDPRIQSLSAIDPPYPTCHPVLRPCHRKLY